MIMLSPELKDWVGESAKIGRGYDYENATDGERVAASGALALTATEVCRYTDDDTLQDVLLHWLRVSNKYDGAKARWTTFSVFSGKRLVNRKKQRQQRRNDLHASVPDQVLDKVIDREPDDAPGMMCGQETKRRVREAMAGLPDNMIIVLSLRFGFMDGRPWTLRQVGERMGVSGEMVRQIQDSALAMLKVRLAGRTDVNPDEEEDGGGDDQDQ